MGLFGGGDTSLTIVIKAKDEASAVFKKMQGNVKKTSEGMKSAGKSLTKGLTAPLVALGTGAIMAAGNFEKSLGDLSTLVGAGTEDMKTFEQGIKDVMDRVPKSGDDLGAAAYQIVSAGISDAALALEVLETSGNLAVAGLSTTEEATDLLTTAINAFGLDAKDSDKIADVLFKTVKAGKTTIAQLSGAFGKMAGNAAAANISFEDVQAATAALTTVTGKTSESQNALAQVFLELTVAGGKLDKSLEKNGGSLDDLNAAIAEEGLVAGFEKMKNELELTDTEFKNLFSSAEGGTAVFQLLTSANESNANALENMKEGANEMDAATKAQNEQFQQQWQLLKNKLNKSLIELGTTIMPMLKDIMEKVAGTLSKVAEWFKNLSPEMKKAIIIGMGLLAALGPILFLLGGLLSVLPLIAAAFTFLTGPIGIVIAAIGLLIFWVKLIKDNWWALGAAMDIVWGGIKSAFKTGVNFLIGLAEGWANSWVKAANIIIKALNSIQISVPSWVPKIGGKSFGINIPLVPEISLPRLEHGGIVPGAVGQPVPIIAHGQETFIPANKSKSGQGLSVTINNPIVRNDDDILKIRREIDNYFGPLVNNHRITA